LKTCLYLIAKQAVKMQSSMMCPLFHSIYLDFNVQGGGDRGISEANPHFSLVCL